MSICLYFRKVAAIQLTNKTSYTLYMKMKLKPPPKYQTTTTTKTQRQQQQNWTALHQIGLINAWNAFLLSVFKCREYLRRRGKLFHFKEPEKERLVLKYQFLP